MLLRQMLKHRISFRTENVMAVDKHAKTAGELNKLHSSFSIVGDLKAGVVKTVDGRLTAKEWVRPFGSQCCARLFPTHAKLDAIANSSKGLKYEGLHLGPANSVVRPCSIALVGGALGLKRAVEADMFEWSAAQAG